jgi:hypothetical protein
MPRSGASNVFRDRPTSFRSPWQNGYAKRRETGKE